MIAAEAFAVEILPVSFAAPSFASCSAIALDGEAQDSPSLCSCSSQGSFDFSQAMSTTDTTASTPLTCRSTGRSVGFHMEARAPAPPAAPTPPAGHAAARPAPRTSQRRKTSLAWIVEVPRPSPDHDDDHVDGGSRTSEPVIQVPEVDDEAFDLPRPLGPPCKRQLDEAQATRVPSAPIEMPADREGGRASGQRHETQAPARSVLDLISFTDDDISILSRARTLGRSSRPHSATGTRASRTRHKVELAIEQSEPETPKWWHREVHDDEADEDMRLRSALGS